MAADRILPRQWDGRRLLRFLTGLALLALAFAVPLDAAAILSTPGTPPAAVAAAVAPAPAPPDLASAAPDLASAAPDLASAAPGLDSAAPDLASAAPDLAFVAAGPTLPAGPVTGPDLRAGAVTGVFTGAPAGLPVRAHGSRGPPAT